MRTLLIDADILVYRLAHQHQQVQAWDHDTWTYYGDLAGARRACSLWLEHLQSSLEADEVRLFISDSRANWRHLIYPQYKGNRAAWAAKERYSDPLVLPVPGPPRPILHKPLREVMRSEFGAEFAPSLEADDLLGITSTQPGTTGSVIVSADKDMQTVPGLLFNPDRPDEGIRTVTVEEADRYHLLQTLTGDSTDNYPGCKGIGPVRAEKILPPLSAWPGVAVAWNECVVPAFRKVGLEEEDALTQARIARVLRHGEYDAATESVALWEPR